MEPAIGLENSRYALETISQMIGWTEELSFLSFSTSSFRVVSPTFSLSTIFEAFCTVCLFFYNIQGQHYFFHLCVVLCWFSQKVSLRMKLVCTYMKKVSPNRNTGHPHVIFYVCNLISSTFSWSLWLLSNLCTLTLDVIVLWVVLPNPNLNLVSS